MPSFGPPPTASGRHHLHTPALRPIYAVASLAGAVAFVLFLAAMIFTETAAAWWPRFFPSVPMMGAAGLAGIALAFTTMALDWVLLGRRINGWPEARVKVTATEIQQVARMEFLPKVR